jgi:hypothetical protein
MILQYISIDLETFSDVDLQKCGVYKYVQSPNFEILLFGYSVDGGEVQVVDLACREKIPMEIIEALIDDTVTKWAFNAAFERVCLSAWLHRNHPQYFQSYSITEDTVGNYLEPASWKCSCVWSAYMGLPLSLAGAGAVLGLEEQKLKEGKDLIRYFCVPCKPTKVNGGRTRNLPEHDMEKWTIFKFYNKRDVEVEMSIQEKLKKYPVPDFVWDEYHLDQEINDRGIAIDMTMVENAIAFDEKSKAELAEKMQELTNLDNPNSVMQMKQWLADNGLEMDSLGKKAVAQAVKTAPAELAEVLALRQQLSKSSVKKYQAMKATACQDNRARGMFKFYGANRTGRWCLTGDHEILTKDGWVRLDEWNGGYIACWNASNEAISFQKAQSLVFDYEGPMYTYKDVRISQCSTPDHKMRAKARYDGNWADMTVEEISHNCRPIIPFTGYRYHRGCANPAYFRVLIMTQADASYTHDGGIKYHFKKERKIERCKSLLRKAEIIFSSHTWADGSTTIAVPARAVPLWLRQFRDKTFGFWLLDENPDIFFDELPHWDGYQITSNSIQYSTCNKQNADIVQALAHMSGRSASMRIKHSSNPKWKDAYVLNIWLYPKNSHEIMCKPTIENYSGKVYCASTTTGYFLVRRDGRVWVTGNSGRNVQLQNLPQNHMPDLKQARGLVESGNYEAMELLYDDIPDTLSQLIRTAFVPRTGYKFVVADFSAIEARVLSYLAKENWRTEVFANNGDIYCASASAMFGVPVEKHGVNGHLRQKGKQAELACIAEGQLVLTDKGLVPIENVTMQHKLWDGETWVSHDGVVYKGEREVINYEGLTATTDHLVWVEGKSEPIQFGIAAASGVHLIQAGNYTECSRCGISQTQELASNIRKVRLYDIRNAGQHHRFTVSGKLVHNCGYGGSTGALKAMGALDMGLAEEELQPLVDSWRVANPNIVRFWWDVDRCVKDTVKNRVSRETHGIRFIYQSGMLFIQLPSGRRLAYVKPRMGENRFGGEAVTYEGVGGTKKWERIESYGPKFVENIVQAVSRDILAYAMRTLSHCFICGHVHDELIIECSIGVSIDEICEQMGRTPPWIPGLLLRADGYECSFYQKD